LSVYLNTPHSKPVKTLHVLAGFKSKLMQETCKKGHVQVLQIVKQIPHSTEINTPKKQMLNGKWEMLDAVMVK
jgi:hypothetical protein